MSQRVSVSLSVCKCSYMRGLAIWAPRQTISLFWKCSLKSLGADRSQEQRGKRALASSLLSLSGPFRSQSPRQTDIRLASRTVPEACASLGKPRERGERSRNGNRVAADSLAKAVCHFPLSTPACLSFSHTTTHRGECIEQKTCTQRDLCPGGLHGKPVVCVDQHKLLGLNQPHWQ